MGQAADFFVSYTSSDRTWAEWIAWQLEAEGYQVVVQAWDFTRHCCIGGVCVRAARLSV
jgi:hypothetical protein